MQIKGFYFEPDKSQRIEALFCLDNSCTVLVKQANGLEVLHQATLKDVSISNRIGNTARFLSFDHGGCFETTDNDLVDRCLLSAPNKSSLAWVHQLESRLALVMVMTVLVSFFAWGFVQYGVPALANSVAKIIPYSVSHQLGKGALSLLDKAYFKPSTLSADRQNELVGQFKSYQSNFDDLEINVVFRHGGDIGANAFALPDGHIVFTDEMVALADDDRELLAVFAHEMGHLYHKHLLKRIVQDSVIASLVVLMTGDISYVSSVVVFIPSLLLELAYSRQFELEADGFALDFLQQHNIGTQHFSNLMLRLDQSHRKSAKEKGIESNFSSYLSSHPETEERIKPFL